MTEEKTVRFGILGAAGIANKVIPAINKSKFAKVVAIGSRDLSKAQEMANKFGISRVYGDYDSVINDECVDVVYIPVVTKLRTEWAIKTAKAKKHLLVEKPLASVEDCKRIQQACRENGVQFMDNTMFVHHRRTYEMKSKQVQDELGPVKHISCCFNFYSETKDGIRWKKDLEPLGALGDLGWYCVRMILWQMDYEMPVAVSGTGELGGDGVYVHFNGTLHFKNGTTASFVSSFLCTLRQTYDVMGTKASLFIKDFVLPFTADLAVFPSRKEDYCEKSYYTITTPDGKEKVVEVDDCLQEVEVINTYANLVRSKQIDERWFRETLCTQIVIDALKESADSGKVVKIE